MSYSPEKVDRNQAIFDMVLFGCSQRAVARHYGLTQVRVHQVLIREWRRRWGARQAGGLREIGGLTHRPSWPI